MRTVKALLLLCVILCTFQAHSQSYVARDSTDLRPVVTKSMYVKGQRDAELHYKKYKGAGTGTLVASILSPLVGLVPAIACSATMPKEVNLGTPQPELLAQEEYYLGYTQKAKKIKSRKVWTNWAIGFGANLVIVLAHASGQ
ncbi:MAG: hypothetical protein KKG00_13210 [Bacteroidetes bacterium]|nr:hypothetical protein [Bacteroidota bacterium]